MWMSQVLFTPITALSPKRVSWSVMYVCRECSWLSDNREQRNRFLNGLAHINSILLQTHFETAGLSFPGREETACYCPWVLFFFCQVVSCSHHPFWLCLPNGKEHRKSVMKHVLYTIPIEPHEKCLLPVSVMKHDIVSLCIQIQFFHVLLHFTEEQHVPMDKPLKHFLICPGNKDRKATPGRARRNKTMKTWAQTHSGL